jgi:hypothetical protein
MIGILLSRMRSEYATKPFEKGLSENSVYNG